MTLVGLVVDLHPVALRLRAKVDRPIQLLPERPTTSFGSPINSPSIFETASTAVPALNALALSKSQ